MRIWYAYIMRILVTHSEVYVYELGSSCQIQTG